MAAMSLFGIAETETLRSLLFGSVVLQDRAAVLVRRHAKVLAVAAAVLSSPTEVPEWMPDAVCALCVLTDEEAIIRSSVTSTIGDFRKSHQDSWEEIRMTWTEDQLRLVSESSGTQSYFS